MSKEKKIIGTTTVDESLEKVLLDNCPDVKNKLKALEVIKEKGVDVGLLLNCSNVRKYNNAIRFELYNHKLTQEEFDLIRRSYHNYVLCTKTI